MSADAIRSPGLYAVIGGEEILVSSHGKGFVRLPAPDGRIGAVRHEIDQLDDVLSVNGSLMRTAPVALAFLDDPEVGAVPDLADLVGHLPVDRRDQWSASTALVAASLTAHPRRTSTTLPLRDSSTVIRTRFLPGFFAQ